MLYSLRKFNESEVAQQKMKIIRFYEEYGEKATKEAFGADRRVISRWKKRLKDNGGTLVSLMPCSTRPKMVRRSEVAQEIIDFIRALREEHPRIGKEKIKPLLDKYCFQRGIKSISESTVGNIIKRHKLFFHKAGKFIMIPIPNGPRRK
jgi:ribosomal protein L31E